MLEVLFVLFGFATFNGNPDRVIETFETKADCEKRVAEIKEILVFVADSGQAVVTDVKLSCEQFKRVK